MLPVPISHWLRVHLQIQFQQTTIKVMVTFFNYHPLTLLTHQNASRLFCDSLLVGLCCIMVVILYCLASQLKWHCGPNLDHGPEFDTYGVYSDCKVRRGGDFGLNLSDPSNCWCRGEAARIAVSKWKCSMWRWNEEKKKEQSEIRGNENRTAKVGIKLMMRSGLEAGVMIQFVASFQLRKQN